MILKNKLFKHYFIIKYIMYKLVRKQKTLIKRLLTQEEIDGILSFVKINKSVPLEISQSNVDRIKSNITEQLKNVEIYPEIIPRFKDELEKAYYKALIDAGEMVGILGATFMAEIVTQLTLNTFHFAGLSSFSISLGVPRLQELLNASKEIKQPSMTLYLKEEKNNNLLSEKEYRICKEIEEVELFDLLDLKYLQNYEETNTEFCIVKPEISYYRKLNDIDQEWYNMYYELYDDSVKKNKYAWSIRLIFDKDKLYSKNITLMEIVKKIQIFRDLYCVSSPDVIGIIDVYIDTTNVDVPTNKDWINEGNKNYYYIETVVIPNLMEILVKGIDNVKMVYFSKTDNKWIKETDGSNLLELFNYEQFDFTRTISNDIWEVYNIFGIEACRSVLLLEFKKIISFGGFIFPCHIENLCNAMTHTGIITSVSRYGIDKDESGPLTTASNEIAFSCLVESGVKNKIEYIDGVSASVITGQFANIGTNFFDIHYVSRENLINENILNCLKPDKNIKNIYPDIETIKERIKNKKSFKNDKKILIRKSPSKRSTEQITVDLSDDEQLSPGSDKSLSPPITKGNKKSYKSDQTIGDIVIDD